MGLFGFLRRSKENQVPPGFGDSPQATPAQPLPPDAQAPPLGEPPMQPAPPDMVPPADVAPVQPDLPQGPAPVASPPDMTPAQPVMPAEPAPQENVSFQVPDFSDADIKATEQELSQVDDAIPEPLPPQAPGVPAQPDDGVPPQAPDMTPAQPVAEEAPMPEPVVEEVPSPAPEVAAEPVVEQPSPETLAPVAESSPETTGAWVSEAAPAPQPDEAQEALDFGMPAPPTKEVQDDQDSPQQVFEEDNHVVLRRETSTDIYVEKKQYQDALIMLATIESDMRKATSHLGRVADNEAIVTAKLTDWKKKLDNVQESLIKVDAQIFEKGEIHG